MSELRGLGVINDELKLRGGRLLVISVDPPETSREVIRKQRLGFSILSDGDCRVIRDFGVLHRGGGLEGNDIAVPSMFLINRQGRLVWFRKATRITDRPDPREVLTVIQTP